MNLDTSVDFERLQSDDPRTRYGYALTLAQAGNKAGIEALCEAIATLAWKQVDLYAVVNALGEVGDETCVGVLISFLSEWTGHAHGFALAALLKIGTEDAVSAVFEELRSPSPWNGTGTAGLIASYSEKYVSRLLVTAQDADPLMRARSIQALGIIAQLMTTDTSIADALKRALYDDVASVRQRAAQGLARMHPVLTEDVLVKALVDEDIIVTQWAAEGLSRLEQHREAALNVLVRSLQHPDWFVQRSSIWALMRIVDDRASLGLNSVHKSIGNRDRISYPGEDLVSLQAGLFDVDEYVRAACVRALARLAGPDILAQFNKQLSDTSARFRKTVLEVWAEYDFQPGVDES